MVILYEVPRADVHSYIQEASEESGGGRPRASTAWTIGSTATESAHVLPDES
jgi:hypothetical protein